MPMHFNIDHARRFLDVKGSGDMVLQDVTDYFDALVIEGGLPYRKLIDLRGVVPRMSDDDIMVLGARVSAYAHLEPRGRRAAILGALIDDAEQRASPRQRGTEARLVALEGIEAAAQQERQLVLEHRGRRAPPQPSRPRSRRAWL